MDDEVYRAARLKAAERETSVSAVVAQFLREFAAGESENQRLKRQERELRERIGSFRAGDRLGREELHARGRE